MRRAALVVVLFLAACGVMAQAPLPIFLDGSTTYTSSPGFALGLKIMAVDGVHFAIVQGGAQSANLTWTLPTAYPSTSGKFLASTTGGAWSWATPGATTGGTGQTTWTLGDLLYSDGANSLAKLPGNTTATSKVLTSLGTGSAATAPVWSSAPILLVPVAEVTATGTVALTAASASYQCIDPNGSDRDVTLPAGVTGLGYVISHIGLANTLTVKASGGATVTTATAGEVKTVIYSGTAWRVL